MRPFLACLAFVFLTALAAGQSIIVTDGDSFTLRPAEGGSVRVRLEGIDAPELAQPGGPAAREALRKMVEGKAISVHPTGRDRYGRTLAVVKVGRRNVNRAMIEAGHAWHFERYNRDPALAAAELKARAARKGLWQAVNPQPPWEWRARKRGR